MQNKMEINEIISLWINYENNFMARLRQIVEENSTSFMKLRQTIRRNRRKLATVLWKVHGVRKSRRLWTHERHGTFWEKDVPRMNESTFKENFRLDRKSFNRLVRLLPGLRKKDTNFRLSIPLGKRIAVALYTLGTSSEYRKIGELFGISNTMVCKILDDFCKKCWHTLAPKYLPSSFLTQEKLEECMKGFEAIGFPQCFGVIDGCHIEINPPTEDTAEYRNDKDWYSVVLLALVDHRCRFAYINVGCPGSCEDCEIYEASSLKKILESSSLLKINSSKFESTTVPVVVLGDSAFPLSDTLMKPYSFSTKATSKEKVFNDALFKAWQVGENAFNQTKARFRRINKGLDNHPSKINNIIKTCCLLHNFLNFHNSNISDHWLTAAKNESKCQPEQSEMSSATNLSAEQIRNAIAVYLPTKSID